MCVFIAYMCAHVRQTIYILQNTKSDEWMQKNISGYWIVYARKRGKGIICKGFAITNTKTERERKKWNGKTEEDWQTRNKKKINKHGMNNNMSWT